MKQVEFDSLSQISLTLGPHAKRPFRQTLC